MEKEALVAILREALPGIVNDMFGLDVEGIKQQFAIMNTAAANASQARLAGLLGVSGQSLVEASNKLVEYYDKLAPHEREVYNDDAAVIKLWESLSTAGESPPPVDTAGSPKSTKLKQSDIDKMPLEEFHKRQSEIEAAYLSGAVEDDGDGEDEGFL